MSNHREPAPKRRRLSEEAAAGRSNIVPVKLLYRKESEIRTSLQELHASLEEYGDVIVRVEGANGASEEFPCVASLLAASSRPLGAMLFGGMRACTPQSGEARPRLQLSCTEPAHFKHLLRFIHGQDIALEVDEAFEMHACADFYEVLGLRDLCGRYLLDSLHPHNCCHLLSRAHEVHCEPLVQRCLDLLMLDFIAVVEHDPNFPSLSAAELLALIARDELVCAEEYEVFEAIKIWYERQPSAEKHAALLELLPLVRWTLIEESRRNDVLRLAALLRPPAEAEKTLGSPSFGESPPKRRNRAATAAAAAAEAAAVEAVANAAASSSAEETNDPSTLAVSLFTASRAAAADPGLPKARQYSWGQLTARHIPPQEDEPERHYILQSTKEYMVGRSRKSDIRIGHQAPMPYISSQHCRIYHSIHWPEGGHVGGGWLGSSSSDAEERAPRLQAWLEDLSQNGTFINGQLVGRNKHQALNEGDRIEMVFPQGRQPAQSNHAFPVFTYTPAARQGPATPQSSPRAAAAPASSDGAEEVS